MPADRTEDPQLASTLQELIVREPIFHRPEFGITRADFESMTAEDFWEIGASGRIYTRADVLDLLEERHRIPQREDLQPSEFRIQRLSEDTYTLHYTLLQGERKTRRTTVWKRAEDKWQWCSTRGQ